MLETQFRKIGLNDNEREVYLAVLKAGKTTHERVAKASGVNRTTVYSIAEKLKKLGLISEDLGSKVNYLVAEDLDNLPSVFRREELRIAEQKRIAQAIVAELKTMTLSEKYSVPRIKFIEENDLNAYLYKRTKEWLENGKKYDNTWWGYHDSSFTEGYEEWIEYCWKNYPDVKVRFFVNTASIEEKVSERHTERQIRALGKEAEFDSSLWVSGDYILMVQTREHPHYLIEIYNPVLARNQRQLFKSLWGKV